MTQHYTIGLDYGSLSCRGVLVSVTDGTIIAEAEFPYRRAVMYDHLPNGTVLPPLWALQDPHDYVNALKYVIPAMMQKSGITPDLVIGICVDTTASTVIAVDRNMIPLCQKPAFEERIHAWPKMWKHHAAWREAQDLTKAADGHPTLLKRCGGKISAESLFPKVLQTLREDPEIYDATESFFECGDWITSLLTGHEIRSGTYLTCKAMWDPQTGYPSGETFDLLSKKLAFHNNAQPVIAWPGHRVGTLSSEMAQELGLTSGTAISAPQMDGYAGLPGSGIAEADALSMVIGTSNAYMVLSQKDCYIPGACASVPNSILNGYVGYAAGQASTGDILKWFTENCVPAFYEHSAQAQGQSIHAYLTELASKKRPGENRLIALDWWNGNKSILNDPSLSGLILGLTLNTKPEDIYRALIEATAYGARRIIEAILQSGIEVSSIVASGGIALKNPMLMQIYANVLNVPISISPCTQAAAVGSAMYAAAAAGPAAGGYDTVEAAIKAMSCKGNLRYYPEAAAHSTYNQLYSEYLELHDYFGHQKNRVMERLKRL